MAVTPQCQYFRLTRCTAVANFFINYCEYVRPGMTQAAGSNQLAIAQALFAIGRFAAAGAMKFIQPRLILWLFMSMIVIFISAAIGAGGNAGIAVLSVTLFFESCIFPTIFTLSLRGLGRHTKRGASFLVASVCGGAVFPPILGVVADARNTQIGMIIPLAGFVVAWSFPLYLNLFKAKELDGYLKSKVGIDPAVENGRLPSVVEVLGHGGARDVEKGGADIKSVQA